VEIPVTAEHKAIATKPTHIAIPETAEPGKISAIVKDPTGKTVPCKVTGNNKPVVEFTPTAVGPHLVEVLDDKRGPSSIPVDVDTPQVLVDNPAQINIPPAVSQAHPTTLKPVVKDPSGNIVPSTITTDPKGIPQAVAFTPTSPGKHSLEVLAKDKPVLSVPVDVAQKATVGTLSSIPLTSAPHIDKSVPIITYPSGKSVPCVLSEKDGKPIVDFVPMEPGNCKLDVHDGSTLLESIPISVSPKTSELSQPATISFPSSVTKGKNISHLHPHVTGPDGNEVPSSLSVTQDGVPQVNFDTIDPGKYTAAVHDQPGECLGRVPVHVAPTTTIAHPAQIEISPEDLPIQFLDDLPDEMGVSVIDPSGNEVPATVVSNKGKPVVEFIPTQPGLHTAEVFDKKGDKVASIPVECKAPTAKLSKPSEIILPTISDLSSLKPVVKDPSGKEVPAELSRNKEGKPCLVFTPKQPGRYDAEVFQGSNPVLSLPVDVSQPAKVSEPVSLPLGPHSPGSKFSAVVKDPSGSIVPSKVTEENGQPILEFVPSHPGTHTAEIFDGPKKVSQVPVEATISTKPIGKPVQVSLPVDASRLPSTSVVVRDPTGKEIPATITLENGEPVLSFTPKSPGTFVAEVFDGPSRIAQIPVTAATSAVNGLPVSLDVPKELLPPGTDVSKLDSSQLVVTDPEGNKIPATLKPNPDDPYGAPKIEFDPVTPGTHTAEIFEGNRPLLSIPIDVVPLKATVGEPCLIPVPSDEASPTPTPLDKIKGSVRATTPAGTTEIPSKIEEKSGKPVLTFVPKTPGMHTVQIQSGPNKLPVTIPVEVSSSAVVSQPVTLALPSELASVPDKIHTQVKDPSDKAVPHSVSYPEKNGPPQLTFTPNEPGKYVAEVFSGPEKIVEVPVEVVSPSVEAGKPCTVPLPQEIDGKPLSNPEKLDIIVKDANGSEVPAKIVFDEDGKPQLSFVPKLPGQYTAELFDGPNKLGEIPVESVQSSTVGTPVLVDLPSTGINPENLTPVVHGPSGEIVPSTIKNVDGKDKLSFVPTTAGPYRAEVFNGEPLVGEVIADVVVEASQPQGETGIPATVNVPLNSNILQPQSLKPVVKDPSKGNPCQNTDS
jgi:hypothetical protein